jgi:hypothetical protein
MMEIVDRVVVRALAIRAPIAEELDVFHLPRDPSSYAVRVETGLAPGVEALALLVEIGRTLCH